MSSKDFGEWLSGLIITLAGMAGAYGLALAWIKNKGIKRKSLEELKAITENMQKKIHEIEKDTIVNKEKIEKVDGGLQQIFKWIMDRINH